MQTSSKKAFTMVELVFVIAVIGILVGVAIPKLAATRNDAVIVKARTTVASIRSAISIERQKRILSGTFGYIFKLSKENGENKPIFDGFDGDDSNTVLEYPLQSCKNSSSKGCWEETVTGTAISAISEYRYNMPTAGSVTFVLINNKFDCKFPTTANCTTLAR